MNILFIWDGDYPWDIRVAKTTSALMAAGFAVHLVCRNKLRRTRRDTVGELQIHRIPSLPAWMGKLNEAFTFPAFFSPVWLMSLLRVGRSEKCKMVIVRDLPMAPAALAVGRILGIPVVMDMAECYPELLRSRKQFDPPNVLNAIVRNPQFADWVEKYCARRVSHTFVMVEESRHRLGSMGVSLDRISIVSNTPDVGRFLTARPVPPNPAVARAALNVLYIGIVTPSRGLDTVIDALRLDKESGACTFKLRVFGSGKHELALKRRAMDLGLGADRVVFEGWVDNSFLPDIIAHTDIGIVPHFKCGHWDSTIPNKLFDYMAAGVPVLVSDAVPAARVVNETKCGRVYDSYSPVQLLEAIKSLSDHTVRLELGANGRSAVMTKYNWRVDSAQLVKDVTGLLQYTAAPASGES